MKNYKSKLIALLLTIAVLFICIPNVSYAQDSAILEEIQKSLQAPNVIPGEVFVEFAYGATNEQIYTVMFDITKRFYPSETENEIAKRLVFKPNMTVQMLRFEVNNAAEAIYLLSQNDLVYQAVPNCRFELNDDYSDNYINGRNEPEYTFDPGAPGISTLGQWHLDTINVMDAWNMGFIGSSSTIVAVLDTGYNSHTQVNANVDTTLSYNEHDNSTDITDYSGHGTFIAGIIGAQLDSTGTNGICQNIKIVPIKITHVGGDGNHYASATDMAQGIQRATQMNAAVINLSFGLSSSSYSQISNSIASFGKLVVFSGGNSDMLLENDTSNAGKVNNDPLMMVIGASDNYNNKSSFSNYSSTYIDLFAPGSTILSTSNYGNNYTTGSGTSYAAPMVTAAIALIMSHATHLTPAEVRSYIEQNVTIPTGTNPLYGLCVTNGYLNIGATVYAIYEEYRGAYSRGDGTGDGYIDDDDADMARNVVMGYYTPTTQEEAALDINGNGSVTLVDYNMIKRYTLKTYYFIP